jgi:magnesium chelatase family protein
MSLSVVRTCALDGVLPRHVDVEVHIGRGLPSMSIVGLPRSEVRESRDRVRAALDHLGFSVPQVRITVNLAPADVPKRGGSFDLPIAIGLLAASGQIPARVLDQRVFLGELGLGGELRAVRGALPVALSLADSDWDLVLPQDNVAEARLSMRTRLLAAGNLAELHGLLSRDTPASTSAPVVGQSSWPSAPDLVDVEGQVMARRVLEIAAAGKHSLLMSGPPGSGKSMLAQRLPGLRPPLTESEAMETAAIASISHGGFLAENWRQRPFRAPHHTASAAALVGGGAGPSPGEISLAHNGVLFLDEIAEFPRAVLDVLREPLETGHIQVSRAARQADFPAKFQLVAAMNPCPCGYALDPSRCRCRAEEVRRYQARLSGPLLDRIDLMIAMQPCAFDSPSPTELPESSAAVRERVLAAVARRHSRESSRAGIPAAGNADALVNDLQASLSRAAEQCLKAAVVRLQLSRRARHRVAGVARTIADLADSAAVSDMHISEALGYRAAFPGQH